MSASSPDLPTIDLARLQVDLAAVSQFGRTASGLCRLGYSDADMQARRWLLGRIEGAGGSARLDAVGNVIGRWGGGGAAVVVGSHLDSVQDGGELDGTLGVLAGLECARVLTDRDELKHPLEVVAFAEEEGRFGGMLGSQAMSGNIPAGFVERAVSADGQRLWDAMRAQGLDPERVHEAARDPDEIHAFLELHIEQGPVLQTEGVPVGIVEGISGVFVWQVTLQGQANHAGTTPMHLRRDAFMAMVAFAQKIPGILQAVGTPTSRLTVGRVEVEPGYAHTVPGRATFSLVGRDLDPAVMRALAEACRAEIHRGPLEATIEERSWLEPQRCDPRIIEVLERSAEERSVRAMTMPSGAGHDTQFMARLCPAGMLFVPSRGGISHAPQEHTEPEDIEVGANVLLQAVARLLAD